MPNKNNDWPGSILTPHAGREFNFGTIIPSVKHATGSGGFEKPQTRAYDLFDTKGVILNEYIEATLTL